MAAFLAGVGKDVVMDSGQACGIPGGPGVGPALHPIDLPAKADGSHIPAGDAGEQVDCLHQFSLARSSMCRMASRRASRRALSTRAFVSSSPKACHHSKRRRWTLTLDCRAMLTRNSWPTMIRADTTGGAQSH